MSDLKTTTDFENALAEIEQVNRELEEKKKTAAKAALKRVQELVTMFGITADQIKFGPAVKKTRKISPVEPKYKNPVGEETWTGRGKKPTWFVNALDAGISEEEMLIVKPAE